jgi:hypothetical protein
MVPGLEDRGGLAHLPRPEQRLEKVPVIAEPLDQDVDGSSFKHADVQEVYSLLSAVSRSTQCTE